MSDMDKPVDRVERLRVWREEREQQAQEKLLRWTKSLTKAAACLVPMLGVVWCAVLCLWAEGRDDPAEAARDREKGLRYLVWALLGCMIWLLIWRLWADDISYFMSQPFIEGAERAIHDSVNKLRGL